MCCPTRAQVGVGVIGTERSAIGVTVVVTLAALFVGIRSDAVLVTAAAFMIEGDAAEDGFTTIVTVAVAPEIRVPRLAVTVPLACVGVVPSDDEAETKVALVGSTSLSDTPVAALGPLLVTVSK